MDILMIALRIIHVVAGVFWAGSVFFMVMILEPRLRALGPQYQGPVMGAIAPVIPRMVGSSAVITILVGVWLALKVQGLNHLDKFYSDG